MIHYNPIVERYHIVKLAKLNAMADVKLSLDKVFDISKLASAKLDTLYACRRDWKGSYIVVADSFKSATKVKYVRATVRRYAYDWKLSKVECRTDTNFEGPVLVTPSADTYMLVAGHHAPDNVEHASND